MTYILNMGEQSKIFALSLGFGFLIGIFYDVLRLFRLLCSDSKKVFFVFDLVYTVAAAVATFLFLLTVTGGSVRAYVLLGELLGFLIYFVTLGTLLSTFFERIVAFLKRSFSKIATGSKHLFHRIFAPFRRLFLKKAKKAEKKAQFSIKKSKIHLKYLHGLLYNQHNMKSAKTNPAKGKESEVRKNGKEGKKEN